MMSPILLVGLGEAGAYAVDHLGQRKYPGVLLFPFALLQPPYCAAVADPLLGQQAAGAPIEPDLAIVMGIGDPEEETLVRELSELLKPRGTLLVYFLTGPASPRETIERLDALKASSSGADAAFIVPHEILGRGANGLERAACELLDALFVTGHVSFDFNDFRCLTRDGCAGIALSLESQAVAASALVDRMMMHPIWSILPLDRYSRCLVSYTGDDALTAIQGMSEKHLSKSARIKIAVFPAPPGKTHRLTLFAGNPW